VLLPKGVTYRVRPTGPANYFLITESAEEIGFADIGPLGRRAPFDPALLYVPSPELDELGDGRNGDGEWPLRIKFRDEYTSVIYDFDPIDAEGWKGDLFPFKLNINDFRPIMSDRVHLMPSAYTAFATSNTLMGALLPRPYERGPDVERVPPYHRNMDYDEFMFAHGGTMLGLPVVPASISITPQGVHHGLPAAMADQIRDHLNPDDAVDMEQIIVDTQRPLDPTPELLAGRRQTEQYRSGVSVQ
jgi:homogentisate 1,2-dioxygenase